MPREHYYVGLDVGSAKVKVVVGKFDPNTDQLSIVGTGEAPSAGLRRGVIVDLEEAVSSISQALDHAERMTGLSLNHAVVSVNGPHINTINSHGVIAVSRADGEITEHDLLRVIDASQAMQLPLNKEILHVIPKHFAVDGQGGIKDPVGMSGIRLEVESTIIEVSTPYLRNLQKCLKQVGLEVDELVLSSLASANSCLTKRHKEIGSVLIDLGAGTTGVVVYEEGQLLLASVVPIGQAHVTNDIAIGLRTTVDTAEEIKLKYGHTDPESLRKDSEIKLSEFDANEDEMVSRRHVVEIMEARIEEILSSVNKELKKINRDGQLPGGVVLVGGGANLPGIVDYAREKLRLPVVVGNPSSTLSSVIDRISDPMYGTGVGLVQWVAEEDLRHGSSGLGLSLGKKIADNPGVSKLKSWFKSFLP
ncbi:MAG: cell division protein FtsA [Candidatus Doudnabacteria bacterium RIFCSPHIGHO2_02_FULL_46_11]|uniref:Cell division protein FtsA n=1 Tax=Candidatus Doudnabacteria bacterium RIFCSPHIGHO2_02_FULL_46_11 TaxID=1817832 RepID=A0A1F5P6Q5_9BACT|nr:MAG: cell division protein FtsA [Candidatus Doudnabacteria bacterium RIFCSPHIGHO2_02_FULL_46_11]